MAGREDNMTNKLASETIRPTPDAYFMAIAHVTATRGTCSRRKVGAVAVRDGRTLATGYNGSPAGTRHCDHGKYGIDQMDDPDLIDVNGRKSCSRAVHAEANVLAYAAKDGIALRGATIYTNTYPCHGCAKQMVSCGIVEVVFDADYNNDPLVTQLCEESGMKLRRFTP